MDQQIDTELTRIENAKVAIREAIIERGGQVPEDALLSTYAEYVLALPSDGASQPDFTTHSDAYLAYKQRGNDEYAYITDSSYIEQLAAGNGGDTLANAWEIWFAPKVSELTQITTLSNFLYTYSDGASGVSQSVSYTRVEGLQYFTSVTTLGERFMGSSGGGTMLVWPIQLPPNLVTIGNYFMTYHQFYDFAFDFPTTLTSIGSYFLQGCSAYNQPIQLPSGLTSLGDSFLNGLNNFNQPVVLPNSLTELPVGSFSNMPKFNSPITFPDSLVSIGADSFYSLSTFNQPITLPDSVITLERNFLSQCPEFNSPLHLSDSLETLGTGFMDYAQAFNYPLELPATLTTITAEFGEGRFMQSAENFTGPLTINNPNFPFTYGGGSVNVNGVLSTYSPDAPIYTEGVTLQGEGAQAWKDQCPDRMAPYRKLIVA